MPRDRTDQQTLTQAESCLRDLAARAASAGDWSKVSRITGIARELSDLITAQFDTSQTVSSNDSVETRSTPTKRSSSKSTSESGASPKKPRRRRSRRSSAGGYPRFFRQDGALIKIGWSKRSRKEYRHKAPRWVIDRLVEALREHGTDDQLITTEHLFPLAGDEEDAPVYQCYVALLWLRSEGLVEPRGRQGYIVPDPESLDTREAQAWERLKPLPA